MEPQHVCEAVLGERGQSSQYAIRGFPFLCTGSNQARQFHAKSELVPRTTSCRTRCWCEGYAAKANNTVPCRAKFPTGHNAY